MNLLEEPEIVQWPGTHYVFVQRVGPFMEAAPQAWQDFYGAIAAIAEKNTVIRYMSLYKTGPKVYRAGVSVAAPAQSLPQGLEYEEFPGGKYSKFVLRGSYADLPKASGRVMELITERKIDVRDDYFIENYLNDPRTTPVEQLVTEILVPTA